MYEIFSNQTGGGEEISKFAEHFLIYSAIFYWLVIVSSILVASWTIYILLRLVKKKSYSGFMRVNLFSTVLTLILIISFAVKFKYFF